MEKLESPKNFRFDRQSLALRADAVPKASFYVISLVDNEKNEICTENYFDASLYQNSFCFDLRRLRSFDRDLDPQTPDSSKLSRLYAGKFSATLIVHSNDMDDSDPVSAEFELSEDDVFKIEDAIISTTSMPPEQIQALQKSLLDRMAKAKKNKTIKSIADLTSRLSVLEEKVYTDLAGLKKNMEDVVRSDNLTALENKLGKLASENQDQTVEAMKKIADQLKKDLTPPASATNPPPVANPATDTDPLPSAKPAKDVTPTTTKAIDTKSEGNLWGGIAYIVAVICFLAFLFAFGVWFYKSNSSIAIIPIGASYSTNTNLSKVLRKILPSANSSTNQARTKEELDEELLLHLKSASENTANDARRAAAEAIDRANDLALDRDKLKREIADMRHAQDGHQAAPADTKKPSVVMGNIGNNNTIVIADKIDGDVNGIEPNRPIVVLTNRPTAVVTDRVVERIIVQTNYSYTPVSPTCEKPTVTPTIPHRSLFGWMRPRPPFPPPPPPLPHHNMQQYGGIPWQSTDNTAWTYQSYGPYRYPEPEPPRFPSPQNFNPPYGQQPFGMGGPSGPMGGHRGPEGGPMGGPPRYSY